MDKLDNETWENYAFRNNLYKIKYSYTDVSVIDDIIIPTNTTPTCRHCDAKWYINNIDINCYDKRPSFMEFIMYELYSLKNYYRLGVYSDPIILRNVIMTEQLTEQYDKDIKRQRWLFKELAFWEKQYEEYVKNEKEKERILNEQKLEDKKKRFIELKANICETHKEQLEEIFTIMKNTSIKFLEGKQCNFYAKDYMEQFNKEMLEEEKERKKRILKEKNYRVELYQKYLQYKDIQTQIFELEQKLNTLKSELIK